MPKSVSSFYDNAVGSDDEQSAAEHDTLLENSGYLDSTAPPSPVAARSKLRSARFSEVNLQDRLHPNRAADESSSLLGHRSHRAYHTVGPGTPRPLYVRQGSASVRRPHHQSRRPSFSNRLVAALGQEQRQALGESALLDPSCDTNCFGQ